jgi:hypothetical protein
MELVDYSERSIAVIGDTKEYKEQLRELGGKYNPGLTVNDQRVAGWIFSKKQQDKVEEFLGLSDGVEEAPTKSAKLTPKAKTPAKSTKPHIRPVANPVDDKYQSVSYRVFKPFKGQEIFLYTYPDDDLKSSPEATDAKVLRVYPNSDGIITKMDVSYGDDKAVAIISDGQWSLRYSSFPNYFDLE